jgi:hypothetical protein
VAIVIEDVEIERLAQSIAIAKGVPVAEVVRESLLLSLAGQRDLPVGRRPLRSRARRIDCQSRPTRRCCGRPPSLAALGLAFAAERRYVGRRKSRPCPIRRRRR